jgi:hypothetical protein
LTLFFADIGFRVGERAIVREFVTEATVTAVPAEPLIFFCRFIVAEGAAEAWMSPNWPLRAAALEEAASARRRAAEICFSWEACFFSSSAALQEAVAALFSLASFPFAAFAAFLSAIAVAFVLGGLPKQNKRGPGGVKIVLPCESILTDPWSKEWREEGKNLPITGEGSGDMGE